MKRPAGRLRPMELHSRPKLKQTGGLPAETVLLFQAVAGISICLSARSFWRDVV